MAGNVLEVTQIQEPDRLGSMVARTWYTQNMLRQDWVMQTTERRKYIYAIDTTKTTNNKTPWKNKTTIPKICQIRDNLQANYMASLFPNPKWLKWEGCSRDADTKDKRDVITGFMAYATAQKKFKAEFARCVLDYIDYGNAFARPVWIDERTQSDPNGPTGTGYVGPGIERISPLDIVMNPIADSFDQSPVIVRSIITNGEVERILVQLSNETGEVEKYEKIKNYMRDYRMHLLGFGGELVVKDEYLNVDGFTNWRLYLQSNYSEILTFYGNIYDPETRELQTNRIITVIDRHKVIDNRANPSSLGCKPIYHIGWRLRQDNLWAMGPLDNLIGMQYRLDHVENLKADIWDVTAFPPLKIKGYVEDFEWGPFAKIYLDEEGDVEIIAPEWNVLTANTETAMLMSLMEEMAGAPKEAMGFRTPGEKTAYEVQSLENAAARIFQAKVSQFEEWFMEPLLNAMLELARREVSSDILARYFDDDTKITKFLSLSPDDISGEGRIIPYAARHFAEQSQLIQNLTNFFASPIGGDPGVKAHFSTIKMAKLFEDLFEITDYKIVMPYIRMAEEADAQRIAQAQQEAVLMEALTPSGLTPDDTRQPFDQQNAPPTNALPQGQPGQQGLDQAPAPAQLAGGPVGPALTHRTGATAAMPSPPANQPQPTSPFQNGVGFPSGNGS